MFASDKRTVDCPSVSRRDIVERWYEVSVERRRESWGAEDIKRSLWRSKVQLRRQSGVDGKAALAAWGMPFRGRGWSVTWRRDKQLGEIGGNVVLG